MDGRPIAFPGATYPGLASNAHGRALTPALLGRLLCHAELLAVLADGLTPDTSRGSPRRVLDLGRTTRLATATQRHALAVRDRGCVFPGCRVPASGCESHHVTWWRNGGATDLDNLALVCQRHHTLVHTGTWSIHMIDGVPWTRPPRWVDRTQSLTRNRIHEHEHQAHQLAQHLIDPDGESQLDAID